MRSQTSYGEETQRRVVATFKTLCEFGDFDADAPPAGDDNESVNVTKTKAPRGSAAGGNTGGVALTVNLQLQLPASESGEVYEKLFAAMGKHLKGLIGTE